MRRISHGIIAALIFGWMALLTAGAVGQSQPEGNPEARKLKNPVPATPESIAAGQQLFQKYCKFCHGEDAKGDGAMAPKGTHPPNLTDDEWIRGSSDGEIFVVIRDGGPPKFDMKALKGKLTDQQMWSLVNYVRSIGPHAK